MPAPAAPAAPTSRTYTLPNAPFPMHFFSEKLSVHCRRYSCGKTASVFAATACAMDAHCGSSVATTRRAFAPPRRLPDVLDPEAAAAPPPVAVADDDDDEPTDPDIVRLRGAVP